MWAPGDQVVEVSARFEDVKIPLRDPVHGLDEISGVLGVPEWWMTGSRVAIALAHDDTSDMNDPLLEFLQREFTEHGHLTIRFNFPFREAGTSEPDGPVVLDRAFRAAIGVLGRDQRSAPAHLFLGGMGLGAQAAARIGTGSVRLDGLFFLGFPLHDPSQPEVLFTEHLYRITAPMFIGQGTRDPRCEIDRLRHALGRVGAPTQLCLIPDADERFRLSSGTPEDESQQRHQILKTLTTWSDKILESA